MHQHAHATAEHAEAGAPMPARHEALVSRLAVMAVVIAAVTAAVMQTGLAARAEAFRVALPAGDQGPPAACAQCGVVEAAKPLDTPARGQGTAWQMRIRMDDGSLRTVNVRGALAAGSRVTVAGGTVRLLRQGPGRG